MLAGAGIFNGVTKYVAQYHVIRSSCAAWSALHQRWYLASYADGAGFCAGGSPNQPGIVCNTDYQGLVRLVALVQMGIAWATCYWR